MLVQFANVRKPTCGGENLSKYSRAIPSSSPVAQDPAAPAISKQAQELSDGSLTLAGASAYRWMVAVDSAPAGAEDRGALFQQGIADRFGLVGPGRNRLGLSLPQCSELGTEVSDSALEKAPEQPYPWYVTGQCQAELEMVGAAIHSFQRCLDVSPGHEDARQQIATLSDRSFSPARWLRRLLAATLIGNHIADSDDLDTRTNSQRRGEAQGERRSSSPGVGPGVSRRRNLQIEGETTR